MATNYDPGPLTGDDTHLHLAAGYQPGRRFHSAEVIRLADAKKVQLGHVHRADARWRLYAFADAVDPRNPASRLNQLMDFLAGPNSPVAKYTPKGWDADSVFDVRAILQQLHLELDWAQMHDFLKPSTGPLGLTDYEKIFCPVPDHRPGHLRPAPHRPRLRRARRGPPRPVRRTDPTSGRLRRARRVLRPVHEPRLTDGRDRTTLASAATGPAATRLSPHGDGRMAFAATEIVGLLASAPLQRGLHPERREIARRKRRHSDGAHGAARARAG